MSQHTKEPLYFGSARFFSEVRDGIVIHCQKSAPHHLDPIYAIAFMEDHARRIVACVNACAGIPTEMLEAMPSGPASLLPMYAKLEAERDELLAALKEIVTVIASENESAVHVVKRCFCIACDAIAKMEGK